MTDIRSALKIATIYETFQIGFGFSKARETAINTYLDIKAGDRVFDVGCGPGKILEYLPTGIEYIGFDIDDGYIEHANKAYQGRGQFFCRPFDDKVIDDFGQADWIMFNGVIHHLDNALAQQMLSTANRALVKTGKVCTLDGCYRKGQNQLAKLLLDMDRGEFVRSQPEYEKIMRPIFAHLDIYVREDLSLLPYTFIIMIASKRH